MIAVLVELDLHVPASTSLKDKRAVVKHLQARLRRDLGVSVAEIGHQDLRQRAVLGIAIAASSEVGGRKVAQQVEDVVHRELRVEIIDVRTTTVGSEA